MRNYSDCTNEELVEMISSGNELAYEQLFLNIRPIILYHAEKYKNCMDTYNTEDFLQEGYIVAWQIISSGNYNNSKGAFSTYFSASVRKKFYNLYRDYTLKNFICIGENEDIRGNIIRIMVEADFAKEYREKKVEQQKRWYEKKKAQDPVKEKKPPMTKEEKTRKIMAWQREYYRTHPDKLTEEQFMLLNRLVEGKATLLKHAFKTDSVETERAGGKITFPWFTATDGDHTNAYSLFLTHLIRFVKKASRLTAHFQPAG